MRIGINIATAGQFAFIPLFLVPDIAFSVHQASVNAHRINQRYPLSYKLSMEAANLLSQGKRQ